MNHPQRDAVAEIRWMAEMGLEFVDLTLEPPGAATWIVDPKAILRELETNRMGVIGHTAYYLPVGSPFEELRKAAITELKRCLQIFSEVGADWMNIHPDRYAPMHDREFYINQNIKTLVELIDYGKPLGVGIMVENIPQGYNRVEQLKDLLDPLPELALHLDIGHCNIRTSENTTEELLVAYGKRLAHVHLHDNNGHEDQHLPLGAGKMDWKEHVAELKDSGYNGTITLEVFTQDKFFLKHSRDVLREFWDTGRVSSEIMVDKPAELAFD